MFGAGGKCSHHCVLARRPGIPSRKARQVRTQLPLRRQIQSPFSASRPSI
ncbi:hypothetical protein SAMCCGM7_Ch1763 [Sinorhizobium americanum CCGM7]|nr:hypothetical protein SAMCCGM7_Ch1763 [Sinorhizobium americanum CCGM7]